MQHSTFFPKIRNWSPQSTPEQLVNKWTRNRHSAPTLPLSLWIVVTIALNAGILLHNTLRTEPQLVLNVVNWHLGGSNPNAFGIVLGHPVYDSGQNPTPKLIIPPRRLSSEKVVLPIGAVVTWQRLQQRSEHCRGTLKRLGSPVLRRRTAVPL